MLKFDAATMTDPVLIREDGSPLFILSGVVDDAEFGISHIIRGDDHITNTAVQIQIFEALGAAIPVFAHFSQLVDAEGGKLSKRKGGLGIMELHEQGIEPLAIVNLLARLGTADPIEAHTTMQDVIDGFELTHFSKSAARLDMEELARLNAKILHAMPFADAQPRLTARGLAAMEESFWLAVRGNLSLFADIDNWWQVAVGPVKPMIDDRDFIATAASLLPQDPWDDTTWGAWTAALKAQTAKSGKGLFLPLRLALTGQEHGPEMRVLLPLIGRERALERLAA
jgi:glutamyl-tRNA synthetase